MPLNRFLVLIKFLKKPKYFPLLLIVLFGALLRLLFLDKFPVGFHSQEAVVGYRAFSIAVTARDELERFLPILFTSFQDFQLPFPTYLLVIFVRFFGLSEFSTRLPFAILGTLSVAAIYGIVRKIFSGKQPIALWSAFFLAVNPWDVFLSRVTSDIALSFHLFLLGLWALVYSKKNFLLLATAFFSLLASLYSSKIAWFFVPVFLAIFIFTPAVKKIFQQKIKRKFVFFLILILFYLPILIIYFTAPSVKQSLFLNDLSFFSDISTLNYINQMRGEAIAGGVPLLGKVFFNKSFYFVRILENFFMHFNPRFLFASNSQPLTGLTNFGPILLSFLPVTVLGLIIFLRKNHPIRFLYIIWLVLAILPSVFVYPTLNQERLIFMLPIVAVIFSIGISSLKPKWLLVSWMFVLMLNFVFVIYDTVVKESKRTQKTWLYGYEETTNFISPLISSYDEILVTNSYAQDPLPILVFFLKIPPQTLWQSYSSDNKFTFKNWIQKAGNIQVEAIKDPNPGKRKEKTLFISTPEEIALLPLSIVTKSFQGESILPAYRVLRSVKDLDGNTVLQIGEFLRYDENGQPI